jgi:hypothetical protein
LEKDVLAMPDSSGLDPFGAVVALGTAMPDIRDPANPTRPGAIPSGFPSNGGTWGLSDVRWVFGMPTHSPVYVRFARVRGRYMEGSVRVGDRLLVAIHAGDIGDTLIADPIWHPMLVRNGQAAGFGVPADSMRRLYDKRGQTFVLRSSTGR